MKKLIYVFLVFCGLQANAQLACLTPTLVLTDPTLAGNPVISPTIDCNYTGLIMVRTTPNMVPANSATAGNAPCLRFYTSLTNANSLTNNTICAAQGTNIAGCLSPSNSILYTLYYSGLNPQFSHSYTLCNAAVAANFQYSVSSCYDNVIITSGTWNNASPNTCNTITIPANTAIGSSSFAISPTVSALAVIQNSANGSIIYDPYEMAAGVYTVTYTFSTPNCTTSASRTFQISNPFVGTGSNFNIPPPLCPDGPCVSLYSLQTAGSYSPGTWSGTGVSSNSFCPSTTGPGTFAVTYSVGVTAVCSATNSKVFYVAPQPTANAGATQSLTCINNPTVLAGSGGGTYSWSHTTLGNNFSTVQNPTVGFSGTYSLVVNNGTCASSPATMQVFNNFTAPSLPSIGVSNIINCINTTAVISATGSNITYSWTGPGTILGGGTASPTVNIGGTFNYTVTSTVNGCTATSSQAVTQNTTTSMVLSTTGAAINCTNNATSISGNQATYTYTWTAPASGTIVSGQSTPTLNILGTGIFTLVATNPANGCNITRTVIPTTNTTVINPNITNNPTVTCTNPTVTLNGSPGAGVTYTWSGTSIVGSSNNQNASINAGGIYTLSVTNTANGCKGTTTISIATSTTPPTTPVITPTSVILACPAQTAAITGTATGATSYSWIPPAGGSILSGGSTATALVTSSSPGLFTVVATGTNGCQSFQTVSVSPNTAAPTFTLSNPNPSITCASTTPSTTVNITSTVTIASYSWGPSGGISGPTNTASATFTAAGSYTVVIVATNGCISTGVITVGTATTPPSVVAGTGTAQALSCTNSVVAITPTFTPASPNYTYTWTGPGIVGSPNNSSVSVNQAGTYTLAITDTVTGCSSGSFTVAVTGNNVVPTINVTNSSTIGIGCSASTSTAQLIASSSSSVTYLWSTSATTSVITVNTPGLYTVTVTDPATGCSNSTVIAVINATTAPGFSATSVGNFPCGTSSGTVQLAAASSSSNSITYAWFGASIISGSNTATPVINQAGIYTVVATDNITGCSATSTLAIFQPTVIANFTVDVSTGGAPLTVNFTNLSFGAGAYSWTFTPGSTSTSTNPTNIFTTPGTYTVVLVSTNGICSDTHTLEIKVTGGLGPIPGIFTPNGDGKNDPFYIPGLDAYPKNKLQIFNRWGNMIYEAAPYKNDWDGTPNKSSMGKGKLPVGAYFYILDLGDEKEPEPIRKGFVQLEY
ncbi:MAG: gliding motility-associated C-terminal domain-containing protein [Bacteroidia bacterium]|nr:gliding motility-associated C-terminal domain-containing protein [Bacteroidia bacterium]